jgi:hypothetical protein
MFFALLPALFSGCKDEDKVELTGIEVQVNDGEWQHNPSVFLTNVGDVATLTARVLPENAGDVRYSWVSGRASYVSVSVPNSQTTTITALAELPSPVKVLVKGGDNQLAIIDVYVGTPPAESIEVKVDGGGFESAPMALLKIGETTSAVLTARALPEHAAQTFSWESDKTTVATVSGNGATATVNAISAGTAHITATSGTTKCTVTVAVLPDDQAVDIYLTGTANPGNNPIQLTQLVDGTYYWFGDLNAGNYKFVFDPASDLPSLNRVNDSTLVLRETATQPDSRFTIAQAGKHAFWVDRNELTLKHKYVQYYYPELYVFGAMTQINNLAYAAAMSADPLNPGIYIYEGGLQSQRIATGGYFRIMSARAWQSDYFVPVSENISSIVSGQTYPVTRRYYSTPYDFHSDATSTGTWKMTLDVVAMTVTFQKTGN